MKTKNIRRIKQKQAVVEMVSTMLLLSLTVIVFAAIAYFVFSTPAPTPGPIITIKGSMSDNNLLLEHEGGEAIDLDSTIILGFADTNVKILAYDYVDSEARQDGMWGFGELLVFPMYEYENYSKIDQVEVMIINIEPSSSVMHASVPIEPVCDLSIHVTVSDNNPKVGTPVIITITVRNDGNINVSGIKVLFQLPKGLIYVSYTATNGTYDNATGIWLSSATIEPGLSTQLYVTAVVQSVNPPENIQLLILQDGSGSIRKRDWDLAIGGYVSAFGNPAIVPRTGHVEYTFVQFGGSQGTVSAKVNINPTIITNDSITSILTTTSKIQQMVGSTATSCGFLLGTDTIAASSFFTPGNMHVVLLVTDGKASTICFIDGDYNGDPPGSKSALEAAVDARNYLIDKFQMNPMEDEIDVIAVHLTEKDAYPWFKNDVVWPQPGYTAPPYRTELPKQGFVSNVSSWAAFPAALGNILTNILHRINLKSNILQAGLPDPKLVNNIGGISITTRAT